MKKFNENEKINEVRILIFSWFMGITKAN